MRHLGPLAHDTRAEVVYAQLYIQGLTNALRTRVETDFRKHLGPQDMTRRNQMLLLEEVVAVATRTNLEIGVIADVVHATQLQSLAAVVNATSSNSSAQSIFQCINATLNASLPNPLGQSITSPNLSMYGGSPTEVFLRGKRRCFT